MQTIKKSVYLIVDFYPVFFGMWSSMKITLLKSAKNIEYRWGKGSIKKKSGIFQIWFEAPTHPPKMAKIWKK